MGFAKSQMMKYEEQGYSEDIEKYVCYNCVGSDYLVSYIKDNADHNTCDYCDEDVDGKNINSS